MKEYKDLNVMSIDDRQALLRKWLDVCSKDADHPQSLGLYDSLHTKVLTEWAKGHLFIMLCSRVGHHPATVSAIISNPIKAARIQARRRALKRLQARKDYQQRYRTKRYLSTLSGLGTEGPITDSLPRRDKP